MCCAAEAEGADVVRTVRRSRWLLAAAALVLVAAVVVVVVLTRDDDRPAGPTASPTPTSAAPTSAAPTTTPSSTSAPTATVPTTTVPPAVPAGLLGADVETIPTDQPVVALTFDAGANGAGLPSILATLAEEGVSATFFLTGEWAAANADGVAAIRAGGHRVGNHSMTHPHLPALSDAALRDEVLGGEEAIRAAGADPRPLFRFPFGDRDDRTIAAVNDLGYVAVRWTVDTLGWQGTAGGRSAQSVADRVLAALQPGEIVLMHIGSNPDDGTTFDADALPQIIDRIRAEGYGFVTLDALLAG
jgi:peptidoglycan/xylan/chitin deacetylase (PgdA/CDA1 family)